MGIQRSFTHVPPDVLVGHTQAGLLVASRKHDLYEVRLLRGISPVVLQDFLDRREDSSARGTSAYIHLTHSLRPAC